MFPKTSRTWGGLGRTLAKFSKGLLFCVGNLFQPETSLPGSSAIAPLPDADLDPQALLLARQREYKVAALNAKRAGDLDRARELMRIGKV